MARRSQLSSSVMQWIVGRQQEVELVPNSLFFIERNHRGAKRIERELFKLFVGLSAILFILSGTVIM
jgi:hypothetical protein